MPFDVSDFAGALPEDRAAGRSCRRQVATWLFVVAFMVLAMVVLGGVTRLSGSGLSIMEWAPFAGAMPPVTEAEWQRLYHLYQQIPQYALLHDGFGIDGFRRIFWLEWTHRLWGRLIGLAFLAPLAWFWLTRRIDRRLGPRLALLFALGALQGAAGWFMVTSGFAPDSIAVSPYRLVIHLALALALYAGLVWTGLGVLRPAPRPAATRPLHGAAIACCVLVVLTMLAGGFVAGLHAGLDYNTFPLMDGQLLPADYDRLEPFARNLTENVAAVQFDHRLLATLTLLAAAATAGVGLTARPCRLAGIALAGLLGAAVTQYLLGVATLLLVVPAALASLHQVAAMLLLTAALVLLHATRPVPAGRPARR